MGMSATQARFLCLTARKSNVEFEGQQVNQQRTTLSNQSANYYNDLLGMSVPIPPSVDDFTKTVYTFQDGALTNQVTAMIAQADGTYKVSYLRQWVDDFSVVSATTSIINTSNKESGPYFVGAQELRKLGVKPSEEFIENDEYLKTLSEDQLDALLKEEQEHIRLLQTKYGDGDYMVRYVKNSTTEEWNPYFYKLSDLQTAIYDENGNSQSNINCYKIGSETKSEEVKAVPDCKIEKDSSGRYINLTMPQHDLEGNKVEGTEITYALTTSTVTDQDKYEDAMNQYEYEKYNSMEMCCNYDNLCSLLDFVFR